MKTIHYVALVASLFIAGFACGGSFQAHRDHAAIIQAQQNENQAAGLEDECKQTLTQK